MSLTKSVGRIYIDELDLVLQFFDRVDEAMDRHGLSLELRWGLDMSPPLGEDADYGIFPAFDPAFSNAENGFWLIVRQDGEVVHHGTAITLPLPYPVNLADYIEEQGMYLSAGTHMGDRIVLDGPAKDFAKTITNLATFYGNIRSRNGFAGSEASKDFLVPLLPTVARIIAYCKWGCVHNFGMAKQVLVEKGVIDRYLVESVFDGVTFETSGDIQPGPRVMTYTPIKSSLSAARVFVRDAGQSDNLYQLVKQAA